MFRKNYLPNVRIYQDPDTRLWYVYKPKEGYKDLVEHLCIFAEGGMGFPLSGKTSFESFESAVKACYDFAFQEHMAYLREPGTFGKGAKL